MSEIGSVTIAGNRYVDGGTYVLAPDSPWPGKVEVVKVLRFRVIIRHNGQRLEVGHKDFACWVPVETQAAPKGVAA